MPTNDMYCKYCGHTIKDLYYKPGEEISCQKCGSIMSVDFQGFKHWKPVTLQDRVEVYEGFNQIKHR